VRASAKHSLVTLAQSAPIKTGKLSRSGTITTFKIDLFVEENGCLCGTNGLAGQFIPRMAVQ
jgi:hypothetical protein